MSKFSDFGNQLYSGEKSIDFIGRRKYFYLIAAVMLVLAILIPAARGGFNFGIEFRGGSEYRVPAASTVSESKAEEAVHSVMPGIEV